MSDTLERLTDAETAAGIDAVAERILSDTVTFCEHLSVWLGLELDLYAQLWRGGAATPPELAERADVAPRYAREWLEQQTVAGYLTCVDATAAEDERVFHLPPAVAAVLLDPDSGSYLGPLLGMVRGMTGVLEPLADAYRTGGGVPFTAYGESIRHGIGEMNGPTFDTQVGTWIRRLPDIDHVLRTAQVPRILDVGCGVGRSTIALANAYPRAEIRGVDLDPDSIAEARNAAAAAGLAHRVTFVCADAAEIADDVSYDLVTIFEALHDVGDPIGVLRTARILLAEGGAVYVSDEKVAHQFTPDGNDVMERLQYGFSVLHCLPATMAEDPRTANGTVLRMPTLVSWARAAGFEHVEDLEVEDPFWRHYAIRVTSRNP